MLTKTKPSEDLIRSPSFRDSLSQSQGPVEHAHSLPPACYCDDSVLDAEIETIFRRAWLGVGRADRVDAPGAYATLEIAGAPVILLRDKQGGLRAFANSCRHRGARLLDGEGTCRAISCPFHCWTYRLDGRLTGAPHMEATEGFEKSAYGLIEFPAEERAGFAFICLDRTPPDLDAHLGDFEQLHTPWQLRSLVSTRRRRFEVGCNWKAFLEVFNEYYHLKYVHPDSIDGVYARPDPAEATLGAYASQFGETYGTGALLEDQQDHALPTMPGLEGRWALGARYTWIFPNMTFAAGKESLWVYEAYPLGPHRCEVRQTICFPTDTLRRPDFEERSAHYTHRLDAALEEDVAALENQHKGLVSPFAVPGRFSALMEPNVAAFARWCADRL
jgi:phenylpropionate dioxygenase-like ring-hydroxylating dioxygenase large terminal subunit